jgi:mono/diheme cytochrome c family protein
MLKSATALGSIVALMAWTAGANGADVAAGAAKAEEICSECHDPADWEGEDAASLEAMIRDVASGAVKHKKKLNLTDAEIENIAAYWASGG